MAAYKIANNEIAARLGTSDQVAHRWLKRFSQEGLGWAQRPSADRPAADLRGVGGLQGEGLGMRPACTADRALPRPPTDEP